MNYIEHFCCFMVVFVLRNCLTACVQPSGCLMPPSIVTPLGHFVRKGHPVFYVLYLFIPDSNSELFNSFFYSHEK